MWSQPVTRSEEHTSELQSRENLVCRLLLEKKKIGMTDRQRSLAYRRTQSLAHDHLQSRPHFTHRAHLPVVEAERQRRAVFFFFNDTATTDIYTLSLHDALPISSADEHEQGSADHHRERQHPRRRRRRSEEHTSELQSRENLVCRLLLEKKKKKKDIKYLNKKKKKKK